MYQKIIWIYYILTVNRVILDSGKSLSPVRHQGITWIKADLLLIGALGTNISDILKQTH